MAKFVILVGGIILHWSNGINETGMRTIYLLILIIFISTSVHGQDDYLLEFRINSTTTSHFVDEFEYPEWNRYPQNLFTSQVSSSLLINVLDIWNVTIGYRWQNSGADLNSLFNNVPYGVRSNKPSRIKAHYFELALMSHIEVTRRISVSPEIGPVHRRSRYIYAMRNRTEIFFLKPEPFNHQLGVKYALNIDYTNGTKRKITFGLTGNYFDFNNADTWNVGLFCGYRFNWNTILHRAKG